MSWVKLDDQFPQHPKLVEAGPLGLSLFVAGLCYCSRYLTDGFIPRQAVGTLLDFSGIWSDLVNPQTEANAKQIASVLVELGLWDASANGYKIHDYLVYNPSKEQVLATRAARSKAGKEGGLRSGQAREAKSKQNASKSEPRTRTPSPNTSLDTDVSKDVARKHRIPKEFPLTTQMLAWAKEHGFDKVLDLKAETAEFHDYWRGRGEAHLDWVATWQSRIRQRGETALARATSTRNGQPKQPLLLTTPDDPDGSQRYRDSLDKPGFRHNLTKGQSNAG